VTVRGIERLRVADALIMPSVPAARPVDHDRRKGFRDGSWKTPE